MMLRGSTSSTRRKRGGAGEQRVEADLDAGEDGAAEVLAGRADGFDRVGGAEVDDDRRPAVEVVGADGVGDAVGADLARVVVQDRHARLRAGLEHDQTRLLARTASSSRATPR